MKHYKRFHNSYFPDENLLPIPVEKLAQFIATCNDSNLRPASITSMISAISYIHKLHGYTNPTKSFIIKKLLYSLNRSNTSDSRRGITIHLLQAFILLLPKEDHYLHTLLKCMFLVAFFALLRVGEMTWTPTGSKNIIQRENITFVFQQSKPISVSIKLVSFKHSQGKSAVINLERCQNSKICPVRALYKYMKISPSDTGPLFRFRCGTVMSANFFRHTLRSCVLKCHLDPKEYTAHSFRIGGATFAASRNFSNSQIQKLGRWQSKAFKKYIRPSLN